MTVFRRRKAKTTQIIWNWFSRYSHDYLRLQIINHGIRKALPRSAYDDQGRFTEESSSRYANQSKGTIMENNLL